MGKNILLITTMYPSDLRPSTPVCHYFAKEWQKLGYNVMVVYYRSMFPPFYTWAAKLFPGLAQKYVGNYVETDRNQRVIEYTYDEVPVVTIPIFKYVPHGRYTKSTINKKVRELTKILERRAFTPDAIIGHFYNPQIEIVGKLGEQYPQAHTCVSLHEYGTTVNNLFRKEATALLSKIETIGFRSTPIKESFEKLYGSTHKSLLCYSGVSQQYLNTPSNRSHETFSTPLENFIYVGQFIQRKYPQVVAESLLEVYGEKKFSLTYVGKQELIFDQVKEYVESKGLCDRVTFVDRVPREEIIKFYDEAECFIMISAAEVFGLVYLEAMARGCITIAARNEGMQGIIEDGVNGFLCDAGNLLELCSVIRRINNLSPEERRQISYNAIATAGKLSDANVAKNYIDAVYSN